MSGFGGAGAFSDGKYNITNDFGGTLYEYVGKQKATELMKYVDEINMRYGGEGTKMYSTAGTHFKKLCLQNKLNLLDLLRIGVFAHGLAGDCVAEKEGRRGCCAGMIAERMGEAWKRLEK